MECDTRRELFQHAKPQISNQFSRVQSCFLTQNPLQTWWHCHPTASTPLARPPSLNLIVEETLGEVDASIPNFVTQEYSLRDEHPANAVFVNQYKREGGYMLLSDAPGIGIEIDEDLLKVAKTTYENRDLNMIPMRVDGSVGYSV